MFLRFIYFVILVYNTTLRYENVNNNIPRLFVCVSVTVQVTVTKKLYALRIHQRK